MGELCTGRGWAVGGIRLSAEGLMEGENGGALYWEGLGSGRDKVVSGGADGR